MSGTGKLNLHLGITPEADRHAISALFEQAGWSISTNNLNTCYREDDARAPEDQGFLLLHSHPEEAIAHSIANGTAPEQAAEEWLIAANAMVRFYKRHRKQTVMVFVPYLLADPDAQLTAIASHLKLSVHDWPTTTFKVEHAPLLERLMAIQLLQKAPDTTALLAQIDACSIPQTGISYCPPTLELNDVNLELTTLRNNIEENEQQTARLQQEVSQQLDTNQKAETIYRAELIDTIANLRSTENANRKLNKEFKDQRLQYEIELAQQKEQQEELRSQLQEMTSLSRQGRRENNLLLEQLHLVQEELEAKFHSLNQLNEQLLKTETKRNIDLQKLQETEDALQESEKQQKEELAEHRKDLNQTRATLSRTERTIRKLESQLTAQQKSDKESAEYRDQQDYSLAAANYRIQCLQTELNSLKNNLAFKAKTLLIDLKTRLRRKPTASTLKRQAELVGRSGLFNESWYLKTYPDVAEKGVDPILHYLKFGAEESRNPSPEFDTGWYLSSHPDVAKERMNPVVHYSRYGQQEGRLISPHYHPSLRTHNTA